MHCPEGHLPLVPPGITLRRGRPEWHDIASSISGCAGGGGVVAVAVPVVVVLASRGPAALLAEMEAALEAAPRWRRWRAPVRHEQGGVRVLRGSASVPHLRVRRRACVHVCVPII